MKTIPSENLKIKHVVVDPSLKDFETIKPGLYDVGQIGSTLDVVNGNYTLTFYHAVENKA